MRRIITPLAITATLLLGLTACTSAAPTGGSTLADAQKNATTTFTTWAQQVEKTAVLQTKAHAGRTTPSFNCTNNKVQLLDTYALYVAKDFDGNAFLNKFQTYLTAHGGTGEKTKDTSGNNVINVDRDGYAYQILALTSVKIDKLDTTKAILFTVTSPCVAAK